jgi:hypothetical protein
MSKLPWFKLYADVVDNARLRLLAFEDRWHFVALCALKCDGLLDGKGDPFFERKIALKLGLQERDLGDVKRRLVEVGLIDDEWQPLKWEVRQRRRADTDDGDAQSRHKAYVYFISDDKREVVKIGYSKNPWARAKDLQTAHPAKLSVVATLLATGDDERDIHKALGDERKEGEWFEFSPRVQDLIAAIKAKNIADAKGVVAYCSSYVAATKDKEADEEGEEEVLEPEGSRASGDALKPKHVFEKWNEVAKRIGKQGVRDLTPSRAQALRARIAQYSIQDFQTVFAKVEASAFLRDGRFCTFDWIIKRANFQKIIEGNYDD